MMIRTKQLGPADDLDSALRTISEFSRVIVAADTKLGLLLTANGFALMGLVTAGRRPMNVVMSSMATVLEMLLIVCMGYLAVTLRPSLRGAGAGNWFCFPTFPAELSARPAVPVLADHAWRQAAVLAEIAQHKYRRFGLALRWSAITLVVFLVWFTALLLGRTVV
ncbi:hypothetical protein [Nocardia mexicana]|uniref:Pycsar effector protein domain-containing protein n=1 Tax=Nocardia mexicana TaxID=279262 RepID=A0A370HC55_9NOCA|nr:hypothetical protein [Nocardia mexicana]RDI53955.1 hypothetical protein DFR68_10275 [Nocardia mexicana]